MLGQFPLRHSGVRGPDAWSFLEAALFCGSLQEALRLG
jgi:hypothetical protein